MIKKDNHYILTESEDEKEKLDNKIKELSCQFIGRRAIAEKLGVTESRVKYVIEQNRYRVQVGRDLSPSSSCQDLILAARNLLRDSFQARNLARSAAPLGPEHLAWQKEIRAEIETLFKLCGSPTPNEGETNDNDFRIFAAMLEQLEQQSESGLDEEGAAADRNNPPP
jgi:hypothetical protein